MKRQGKLIALANESMELIKGLILKETIKNNINLKGVTTNEDGDTVIFYFKDGQTIEYSLSEIAYIFEDHLEGFEIFSKENNEDIYNKIVDIQRQTETL